MTETRRSLTRPLAERARGLFQLYVTRLILSVLILISLCPFSFVEDYWYLFFAVFAVEFAGRLLVFAHLRNREASRRRRVQEVAMLGLDLLALISFIPVTHLGGARYFRLARFLRLFVLFGYWGGTFRSLWTLITRPERKLQLWVLFIGVSLLSFISATIMGEMHKMNPEEIAHELQLEHEPRFVDFIWWSFRQVQDPGNLVGDVDHLGILMLSLTLTIGGLFLISFLIGIGTTVVEELVKTTRDRPLGLRGHSVLVNAGEHVHFFLDQVVDFYRKQLQRPQWMVLGPQDENLRLEVDTHYKNISYRDGTPYHHADLHRVDAQTAKRIVILGLHTSPDPDAETISAVLSARRLNQRALIYAEIFDERHTSAALSAGGRRTVVVPTEHLLALAMANIAIMPSSYPVLEELLTARGNEIYTYLYEDGDARPRELASAAQFDELFRHAYDSHECLLLGVGLDPHEDCRDSEPDFIVAPLPQGELKERQRAVAGIAGIGANFEAMKALAEDFAAGRQKRAPTADVAELPDLPALEVTSRHEVAAHILVCGFLRRTPLLLEHLVQFVPASEIFVMVHGQSQLELARDTLAVAGRSIQRFGEDTRHGHCRGWFEQVGADTYAYQTKEERAPARVHLICGDWASRAALLEKHPSGYDLRSIQRIIIQAGTEADEDPDARAVMTVMKLDNLKRLPEFCDALHPELHLTVEMVDELKAELLEERFGRQSGQCDIPMDVVATEKIRNVLMFQSTVVPGFAPIFLEIFSRWEQFFYKVGFVQPREELPDTVVHYGQLLWTLYVKHQVLLVGVEHAKEDGTSETLLVPQRDEEQSFPLRELTALYVIGRTFQA